MPIVVPPSLDALGLVLFQINPHYFEPASAGPSCGETRAERLLEFLEENNRPVVGLEETAWLRREGNKLFLGIKGGRRHAFQARLGTGEIFSRGGLKFFAETL